MPAARQPHRGRPRASEPPFRVELVQLLGEIPGPAWKLAGPGFEGDCAIFLRGDAGYIELTRRAAELNLGWRIGYELGYNAGYERARRSRQIAGEAVRKEVPC